MTTPSTRPARRILAVVTVMRDDDGRYVVDAQTTITRRTSTTMTRHDAIDAATAAIAGMADEDP
jgi:hypothetical protein